LRAHNERKCSCRNKI